MVLQIVWSHTLYGLTHCMVLHTVWSYTLYGLTHCVVLHIVWSYTLYGLTHCMVSHIVWSYTLYGLTHCRYPSRQGARVVYSIIRASVLAAADTAPVWVFCRSRLKGYDMFIFHFPVSDLFSMGMAYIGTSVNIKTEVLTAG